MRNWIFTLLIFVISLNSYSQELLNLNLEKSIEIAKEQSYNMLILKKSLERSEYQLKAAKKMYGTKVDLNFDGPELFQIQKQYNDSNGVHFYPSKGFNFNTELIVSQPLPTDGRIYLSSSLFNGREIGDRDEFGIASLATSINFVQPIGPLYSYNQIKSEYKRAELNYESTLKGLKREELNLIYNVSRAYYFLLSNQLKMEIAKLTLERQREAFKIAKNKYAAGLIREVEALQIEVDLGQAENDYDISIANYESQANVFKQSLGLPLKDSVILKGEMDYVLVNVDLEMAVESGLNNRLEVREREINIELDKINLKRQKAEGQIQGDFTTKFGVAGYDKSTRPILYTESINNAFQNQQDNFNNYSLGINVRIPIIDWGENRARVKAIQANIEMDKYRLENEKVNIEMEIRNTIGQLNSSMRRLQLLEKNVTLAEKSFEISDYRFKNGDIDSEAFALDRERLNKTRLSHLDAFITYKLYIADLMRKTFYDFENNQPVL